MMAAALPSFMSPEFLERCLIMAVLMAAAVADVRTRLVPNVVPLAIACIHVPFAGGAPALVASLASAVVLGGGLLAFTLAFEAASGKQGMGGGDVKLAAALAFTLGLGDAAFALLLACGLFVLHLGIRRRHDGPFVLALAAATFILLLV